MIGSAVACSNGGDSDTARRTGTPGDGEAETTTTGHGEPVEGEARAAVERLAATLT